MDGSGSRSEAVALLLDAREPPRDRVLPRDAVLPHEVCPQLLSVEVRVRTLGALRRYLEGHHGIASC